ncbi:hypothetical protein [Parasphingorhabdus sp.]|uniref:hypothetical protein n=1 Tax=Parasphingorhabdus sp. TaxID=2709688 RepID=UPI003A92D25A
MRRIMVTASSPMVQVIFLSANDNACKWAYVEAMYIVIIFLCGICNFAMHKAMLESNHPIIAEARGSFRRLLGPYGSYILEFVMLVAAMIFANMGMLTAVIFYFIYTLANCAAAWVLFSNKH